ncbi:hypothetical protein PYK79_00330 [Streptomyces sp. ID05-04B]|uniref:hypothetical protein n=1 Tax=unclassified Streptomyces TaxID=2593676 RepID=UPI000D1A32B4|nr:MULTISPECIES: hypothetical protein [unclassified Streptomyces]AVV40351.1 hypothetical protein C6376_01805 [Streptomyces sp. P3]MDX5562501.1 hypothetical protein [Streptomyces sp. ID05-04B]
MGTKTADQAGAESGAGATSDEEKVDVTRTDADDRAATETEPEDSGELADSRESGVREARAEDDLDGLGEESVGVGQGAGAVVSAVLGFVSLTGSWVGTIAAQRESILGQMENSASGTPSIAVQLKESYGDPWQITALCAGLFALTALVVGVVVLARPAFGSPDRPQAAWIKSVSWAGVTLGVIGLLLAVLKYTDALLALPGS